MAKITTQQIEAAYEVACQVFDQALTISAAANHLADVHGLNQNSARDFINDYRCMLQGRVFHRAMSAPAVDYFLSRIREDRGIEALSTSIFSVEQHIDYYENYTGANLNSMRSVLERHRAFAVPIPQNLQDEAFNAAVLESLNDPPEKRRERLNRALKIPRRVKVSSYAYVRNPDVVAEVLIRARGICENCEKPAPFSRKSNGTPYLEVHHKIQLAHGGEDTTENSVALCPNCHRYFHYGERH